MKQRLDVAVTYEGVTYNVTGDYYPAEASQIYGPPEKCYEGSDAYIDDMKIIIGGSDILDVMIPDCVLEINWLAIEEHDGGGYEDAGDYAYDKMKDDKLTGDA